MVLASKGHEKYLENSIFTASQEELTLMLYNGIVRFVLQADAAIEQKEFMKANKNLIKAQNILLELNLTLNRKYEISNNLSSIYNYMYKRLVDANIKKDRKILEEVLEMAKDLRDTWTKAMKLAKTQNFQPSLKMTAVK